MKTRLVSLSLALLLVPVPVLAATGHAEPPEAAPPEVARAQCAPGDRPESNDALQGQVPRVERAAGFAGTSCNLRLVGGYPGPGATYVGAAHGDCAFYSTAGQGVLVVDLANPRRPVVTATLTSPAMLRTWESLKVNPKRRLLAATAYSTDAFDVYDIRDCRRPKLLSSVRFPGTVGHEGEWAPDGRTYYITNRQNQEVPHFGFLPVDLTDPRRPRALPRWDTPGLGQSHGLSLSADGRRMYLAVPNGFIGPNRDPASGMLVLDVSGVQQRARDTPVRILGQARWIDGGESQMTIPVTIDGRPHVIANDEWGSFQADLGLLGCASSATGRSAYGYPRVLDLTDETEPRQVRHIRLQVQIPANCPLAVNDSTAHLFSYSTHYCAVDRPVEPRILGCANFESGLRLLDIRDVGDVREIAYYNPPPRAGTTSERASLRADGTDWASSPPVFRLDRGEVWVQFQDNGVQVLALEPSLLERLGA